MLLVKNSRIARDSLDGGGVVSAPALLPVGLVVEPALREVPVHVDARFASPLPGARRHRCPGPPEPPNTVAPVVSSSRPRLDHEPGIFLVDDVSAVVVRIPEAGDLPVPVQVVGAVLVDLPVLVVVHFHGVLSLGDPPFDGVVDAVGVHDGADIEDVLIDELGDGIIGSITGYQLVDDVEGDLGPRVLVPVGSPVDPHPGFPMVGLHGSDVVHPLFPGVPKIHVPIDGGPVVHLRDRPGHTWAGPEVDRPISMSSVMSEYSRATLLM